jgi:hypothetical protein
VVTDPRFIGRSYESAPFEVSAESIRAYMRATGDDREEADLVAPPTYAMVYGFDVYMQLWKDQEVALNVARLVHSDQSFTFHRPVRPGDRIRSTGRITGISARGGMEMITFDCTATAVDGQPVSDASARFIIRP